MWRRLAPPLCVARERSRCAESVMIRASGPPAGHPSRTHLMRKFVLSLVVVGTAVSTLVAQSRPKDRAGSASKPYTSWTEYLGNSDSSAYTALDQINKNTVSQLQVAWTYPTGNR